MPCPRTPEVIAFSLPIQWKLLLSCFAAGVLSVLAVMAYDTLHPRSRERLFRRHPRLTAVLRRMIGPELSLTGQMFFSIRFDQSPSFELGPHGCELSCYIPAGVAWQQINYGQSEGQVEIDGHDWGFYWNQPAQLAVVLHSGSVDVEAAVTFVRNVAEKLSGSADGFRIVFEAYALLERPPLPYRRLGQKISGKCPTCGSPLPANHSRLQ